MQELPEVPAYMLSGGVSDGVTSPVSIRLSEVTVVIRSTLTPYGRIPKKVIKPSVPIEGKDGFCLLAVSVPPGAPDSFL
jgi:hypothetical protein